MLKQFKDYRIQKLLGKGGMAEVYLARSSSLQKAVALKILPSFGADDPQFISRFKHEIKAHSSLDHPNIVKVYEGGEHEGQLYFAMEYIDGWTVSEFQRKYGNIIPPIASFICKEVLKGLKHSHESGVIHRDIKPANIMISRNDGQVKIADFGLVKAEDLTMLTRTGEILGTPCYMSPEQASGEQVDHRTDLYSLGVMLYEMLSGVQPFYDTSLQSILRKAAMNEYKPLWEIDLITPFEFHPIVERLMSKNPSDRYANADEALKAIKEICGMFGNLSSQDYFRIFITNPSFFIKQINELMSNKYLDYAKRIYERSKTNIGYALLEVNRALKLDPENKDAQSFYKKLTNKSNFHLEEKTVPHLQELETRIVKEQENYNLLLSLAKGHQNEGNLTKAFVYYKRLQRLKPGDDYVSLQLKNLLGKKGVARVKPIDYTLVMPTQKSNADDKQNLKQQSASKPDEKAPIAEEPIPVEEEDKKAPDVRVITPENFMEYNIERSRRQAVGSILFKKYIIIALIIAFIGLGGYYGYKYLPRDLLDDLKEKLTSTQEKKLGEKQSSIPFMELYDKAQTQFAKGNYDKAIELYQAFLNRYLDNPMIVQSKFNIARSLNSMGMREEALNHLNEIIQFYKGSFIEVDALYEKAMILINLGRKNEAERVFDYLYQKITLQIPFDKRYTMMMANANLLSELKDYRKALLRLDYLVVHNQRQRKIPDVYLKKGEILLALEDYTEARRAFEMTKLDSSPGSAAYQAASRHIQRLNEEYR